MAHSNPVNLPASGKYVRLYVDWTAASTRANILTGSKSGDVDGEALATSMGKIAKWYTDFKVLTFTDLTTASSGSGNAVTALSYDNATGKLTFTKGSTFLTQHPTITTDTDTTSTASPSHGGTFTAIDSVTRDTNGHVKKVNTKTVALPAQYSHPTYTRSNTTSSASPAHGETFTVIDSITSNTLGHVTAVNTKTITLPADSNTDTKVTQSVSTTTNYRPLILGATNTTTVADLAATVTGQTYATTKIYAQPSTGKVYAAEFVGKLFIGKLSVSTGGTWIKARDNTAVLNGPTATAGESFYPIGFAKTNDGGWAIGGLANTNTFYLSYTTDEDYDSNTNKNTYLIEFPKAGGTVALTKNLSAYIPLTGSNAISGSLETNSTTAGFVSLGSGGRKMSLLNGSLRYYIGTTNWASGIAYYNGDTAIGNIGAYGIPSTCDYFYMGKGYNDYSMRVENNDTGKMTLRGTLPQLKFQQTTSNSEYDNNNSGIIAHPSATYGMNMTIQSGGNMIIGSGEYPTTFYNLENKSTTFPDYWTNKGEQTYIGSDNYVIIHTNADTIANRKTFIFGINFNLDVGSNLIFRTNTVESPVNNTLTTAATTTGREWTLPDATGTICLTTHTHDSLTTKTLTATTLENTAGNFFFGGSKLLGGTYDWVGIQADAGNDKFQLIAQAGGLIFRQNDSGGTDSTNWNNWVNLLTPDTISGTNGITATVITSTIGSGTSALTYNSGVQIGHSNSVTAVTTAGMLKVKYDAHGHITGSSAFASADVSSLLNLLTTGSSTPVDADYYISQYVGGGTTTTTYHRRTTLALYKYLCNKRTGYIIPDGSTVSDSANNWFRIAYSTATGTHSDIEGIFVINYAYSNDICGILKIRGRTEGTAGTFGNTKSVHWLVKDDSLDGNSICVIFANNKGSGSETVSGSACVEIWVRANIRYATITCTMLNGFGRNAETNADWTWHMLNNPGNTGTTSLPTYSSQTNVYATTEMGITAYDVTYKTPTPSGKVNTQWGTTAERTRLVTKGWMSYWDGSYDGSASNLTYCNRGAFGTIVTHAAGDYVLKTGDTMSGNLTLSKTSGDTYFYATRSDTDVTVGMGVGSGGTNHGLYSFKLSKWIVYGDASNVYLNGNASTATNVYVTLTNPSSSTTYYLPFISNVSSGNTGLKGNNGITYSVKEGTTSATGVVLLALGNTIGSGTAGNKSGSLRMYGTSTGYTNLNVANTTATNYTATLPNATGRVGIYKDLYTSTAAPTTTSETINLNSSKTIIGVYDILKVWIYINSVNNIRQIDLCTTTAAMAQGPYYFTGVGTLNQKMIYLNSNGYSLQLATSGTSDSAKISIAKVIGIKFS